MPPANALRGATYSFIGFMLYSLNDITIKFLGSDYSNVQILFFSGMAGFPLVIAYMMMEKDGGSLRPVLPIWTVLRCIIVVVNGLAVSYTFANLPIAQSYAIFFLLPLLICVLAAFFLGEKIDLPRGIAVVAGLIGVLIVIRPTETPMVFAHFTAICGAILGSVYFVILRKSGGAERMTVLLLYPMIAQVAVVACMLPFFYKPMPIEHLGLTAMMALEGFLGTLLVVSAYRLAPVVVVAPMQYGQIIWATIFGVYYFDEPMTGHTITGIGIIIASGLYIMLKSHWQQKAEAAKSAVTGQNP